MSHQEFQDVFTVIVTVLVLALLVFSMVLCYMLALKDDKIARLREQIRENKSHSGESV